MSVQPALMPMPAAGFTPIDVDHAYDLTEHWGHDLPPTKRPFGSEAWGIELDGRIISVAISASIVSATVTDELGRVWRRGEVVELARQCSDPAYRWATRPCLRFWREVAAPPWSYWHVGAVVSYSNHRHRGDIYRFDGWKVWQRKAGRSGGGGAWSRPRYASDAAAGDKVLWGFRFEGGGQSS